MMPYIRLYPEAPEPRWQRGQLPPPPALCSRGQGGGQLCPFLIAIELFYHLNNFASDVRNVINESELIVVGRDWSSLVILNCTLPGYYILFVHIISYVH